MRSKASKENYWHYNPSLKELASEMRRQPTKAEACLWYQVLKGEGTGYKFIRQRPVLNYIVDFFSKELMLVIEVDGYSHHFDEVWERDLIRQQHLEEVGFTVLRFSDEEVMNSIENVRARVLGWIEERLLN